MPKTSLARIRLYLKLGKVFADGSSPIMLMCSFNGDKKKRVNNLYTYHSDNLLNDEDLI